MIEVDGKEVFTELAEIVQPEHTALVVVDMQRDFVDTDGFFGSLGIDLSMYDQTRPPLLNLLAAARKNNVLVVHVQNTALPEGRSDSPAQIRFNLRMHEAARGEGPPLRYTVEGTPGHGFSEDFEPVGTELVVRKYRSSGFWGTNLNLILGSNGIKSVVVTGCTTEGCVESTARDALFSDYYVVIATDCVGSDDKAQHDASMSLMRHRFDLAESEQIADAWAAGRP
ncbi:MAG: isochorismatase [Marmoricola sp.]|jgi:nicotinamidase-related amidase|nr:isochorismatase [Marmoricola sp.]